jgi:hypothetical protein
VTVNDGATGGPKGSSWLLSLSCFRARPAPAVVFRGGETPDPRAGAELIACDAAIIHDVIPPSVKIRGRPRRAAARIDAAALG